MRIKDVSLFLLLLTVFDFHIQQRSLLAMESEETEEEGDEEEAKVLTKEMEKAISDAFNFFIQNKQKDALICLRQAYRQASNDGWDLKEFKQLFNDFLPWIELSAYWGGSEGDDINAKIRRFRATGEAIFIAVLRKGHWIPVVMTKLGMITANSYGNASLESDFHLQKIYDFFLVGYVGEKEQPLTPFLTNLQSRLTDLVSKLKNLPTN